MPRTGAGLCPIPFAIMSAAVIGFAVVETVMVTSHHRVLLLFCVAYDGEDQLLWDPELLSDDAGMFCGI